MLRQRRIHRHCSVRQVRFIFSGFARLACELFTKPSEIRLFTKASNLSHDSGWPCYILFSKDDFKINEYEWIDAPATAGSHGFLTARATSQIPRSTNGMLSH